MTIEPADGESQTKQMEGKEWNWCPTHAAWVRHLASECRGIGFKGGNGPEKDGKSEANMKISKALAAINSDEEDDESEEDEE